MYTHAEQLTLAWDANSEPTLAGYKVYWGTSSANYSWSADAGARTTYTVVELSPGATYYFAATAYDSARSESSFSSEKAYTVPATCTNTITPTSQVLGAGGGTGTINVTTAGACNWTTSNTSSWISLTSGASGTGSGTVSYNVSANTGTAPRTAGLTVAGNIFTVTQSAPQTTYTITATARTNGAISPAGSSTVSAGASKTFTITPAEGYRIQSVIVDGASIGPIGSYTFTNVRANHAIQATFKQVPRSKTTRVTN
jgi:fibronectin type 3 domain-containing protein